MKVLLIGLKLFLVCLIVPACKDSKKDERVDKKNAINAAEVPLIVRDSFAARYPGAAEVLWENAHEEDDKTYKVKFSKEGVYWKAEFKGDGSFIKGKEDE
jgi:hypothetical protein